MATGGTGRLFVFDAFGTLFDTTALVERLTDRFADHGPAISATWRATQLRSTWLRTLMDAYEPFDRVTRDALTFAVRSAGQVASDAELDELAALYAVLPPYPEAGVVLGTLHDRGATLAILSNGSPGMLRSLVEGAGLAERFEALLSVDTVRAYKPHPEVYGLVGRRFGTTPGDVRFVSGNGWDCAGARRLGFDVTWIDRAGAVFDGLEAQPDRVGRDLRVLLDDDPVPGTRGAAVRRRGRG